MTEQKQVFPNSGALFLAKTRVHPKSPDMNGEISIERSLIRQLMDEQDGDSVKIRLSAWSRSSSYGDFISLAVNTYKPQVNAAPQQHLDQNPDNNKATPVNDSDIPF